MATIIKQLPRYVREIENRHGTPRLQFQRRRGAPRQIMTTAPGTPEFEREYGALMAGLDPATMATLVIAEKSDKHLDQFDDSVGALCAAFMASDGFLRQHLDSQVKGRRLVNNMLNAEVPFNGKPRKFATWPCEMVTPTDIIALRSAVKPERATKDPLARHFRDQHVQTLRAVWNWGLIHWTNKVEDRIAHVLRTANPCAKLKPLAPEGEGWETATPEEVATFEKRFPVGTMAHLAMALLRYTMVRRGDAAMLGWPMVVTVNGEQVFHFVETKGKANKPKVRDLPLHPNLLAVIQATPGAMNRPTLIVGANGEPLLAASFGELFKEWLVEAGLPHLSAHSIRKFVATELANKKASAHTIKAMGGWSTLRQVERYTKKAMLARLSAEALTLM